MTDFCLVCGKRHEGAVRGGKVAQLPEACRLHRLQQQHPYSDKPRRLAVAQSRAYAKRYPHPAS